jgi:hypothetical protein
MIRGLLARPGGEPYLGGRFSVEITEDRPRNAPTYRPERRKRRQGVAVLARDGHQVGRVSLGQVSEVAADQSGLLRGHGALHPQRPQWWRETPMACECVVSYRQGWTSPAC